MQSLLQQAADQLWQAEKSLVACAPIRELYPDISVNDAYAIQKLNIDKAVAAGRRIVGHKIGLTSTVVQKQLGVDSPDFGTLLDDKVFANGDSMAVTGLMQPKVEAEIALVLKNDLAQPNLTVLDVINAIDYVLPAIEVVDSRVENWNIRLVDTVADNASYGAVFVGTTPVKPEQVDFRNCGMMLKKNGSVLSTGTGANCLGNPVIATLWLAKTMQQNQQPLKAGELILTGALGAMVTVDSEGAYQAHIQGVGDVCASFHA